MSIRRDETGQALAIVVIVMMLLIGFSVSLANQSNDQAPVAQQSVMQRLALQAAQAGIADYQDFIDESPLNASSFCSYSTFSCNQLSTNVSSGTIPGTITTAGGTNAPTAFNLADLILVTTSAGSQMSVSCTGSTTNSFTGCTGGSASLLTSSYATQFEVPGDGDPAFASSFTSTSSCQSNTITNGWADATVSSITNIQAAYQYVVDSTALYSNSSGGIVKVYATGRAGISGHYVCSAVQASFWVQLAEPGEPQTIPTDDAYSSVVAPTATCSPTCTTTTATFTVWGASGGNGGTGYSGTGGSGGAGEEIEATFVLPVGAVLGTDLGYQGVMAGNDDDPSTTVASGSNGATLPTWQIAVGSTSGFAPTAADVRHGDLERSDDPAARDLRVGDIKYLHQLLRRFGHSQRPGAGSPSRGAPDTEPAELAGTRAAATRRCSGSSGHTAAQGQAEVGAQYASSLRPEDHALRARPLCTGQETSVPAAPGCVLVIAAGGGGAGEGDFGGSAGNGGNGGGAELSRSRRAPAPTTPVRDSRERGRDRRVGWKRMDVRSARTRSHAGGGQWTPSGPSETGGARGTGESIFGDTTPADSPGSPYTGTSPSTVGITGSTVAQNGANGPGWSGDGCLAWCAGIRRRGRGRWSGGWREWRQREAMAVPEVVGVQPPTSTSAPFAITPTAGSNYTKCPNYSSGCAGSCLQVGTAGAGSGGWSNEVLENIVGSNIPVNTTQCLNSGGGNAYTACSPPFASYPNWYSGSSHTTCAGSCVHYGTPDTTITSASNSKALPQSTINVASTSGFDLQYALDLQVSSGSYTEVTCTGTTSTTFTGCTGGSGTLDSATGFNSVYEDIGQLEACGSQYDTEAPPATTTGSIYVYGGGGGGAYNAGGVGGNGAAATVNFIATPADWYGVELGCGGGGGGTSWKGGAANACTVGTSGSCAATTNGGGGGGGASWLCFEGSSQHSCSLSTSNCSTTTTLIAPCLLAVVGGGGGGGNGGGPGGGESSATSTCSATAPVSCNGYPGYKATTESGAGAAGNSWFDSANTTYAVTTVTADDNSPTDFPAFGSTATYPCTSTSSTSEQSKSNGQAGSATTVPTTAEAGAGCGGYDPSGTGATGAGYGAYAGQLGLISSAGYVENYGWTFWTVDTPALESGACNYTPPSTYIGSDNSPSSTTVSLPNSGTYTISIGGGAGAGGWATSGSSDIGTGGSGTLITFRLVGLTAGQELTVVAGCGGFGPLGGIGLSDGGSSGFQPQGQVTPTNTTNETPDLNGVGGGGGGSSGICLSPAGTTGVTCTESTPLCNSVSPTSTCLVSLAGGGGGGGTECSTQCTTSLISISTDCTTTSPDLNGGGLSSTTGTSSWSGYWDGSSYTSSSNSYGTVFTGAGGGGGGATSGAPQSYDGDNAYPNSPTGGNPQNGGNGGWYAGPGYPTAVSTTLGGIGAGGGGAGFEGGWADPWAATTFGQSVPTDANPGATSASNAYETTGSATECGGGGGSSWVTGVAIDTVAGFQPADQRNYLRLLPAPRTDRGELNLADLRLPDELVITTRTLQRGTEQDRVQGSTSKDKMDGVDKTDGRSSTVTDTSLLDSVKFNF